MALIPIQKVISRGSVLLAALGKQYLNDPSAEHHRKFVVVLNCDPPDDTVYVVMATSKFKKFEKLPKLARESMVLDHGAYDFLNRPTTLDFSDLKEIPTAFLQAKLDDGKVDLKGTLSDDDIDRLDTHIKNSWQIEPRIQKELDCG